MVRLQSWNVQTGLRSVAFVSSSLNKPVFFTGATWLFVLPLEQEQV